MLCCDAVHRGGAEREQWRPLYSSPISIFHSDTHNQTGPLWCWFLSGWACAHSSPLWVSPTTSPMRLGISPAAAPTLTGVFNQRFEALFPSAGALACTVCFDPRHSSGLSVRECGASVCYPCCACPALCHSESSPLGLSVRECGAAGSASAWTACPVCPTFCQSGSRHGHSSPLHPGARLCPSYWSG